VAQHTLHVTQDVDLVRVLSESPQFSFEDDFENNAYVSVIPDASKPPHAIDENVRLHLANQRCVILKAQHLEGPTTFCKDEIEAARGPLSQRVGWHGE